MSPGGTTERFNCPYGTDDGGGLSHTNELVGYYQASLIATATSTTHHPTESLLDTVLPLCLGSELKGRNGNGISTNRNDQRRS
jgi:hypothetical protein